MLGRVSEMKTKERQSEVSCILLLLSRLSQVRWQTLCQLETVSPQNRLHKQIQRKEKIIWILLRKIYHPQMFLKIPTLRHLHPRLKGKEKLWLVDIPEFYFKILVIITANTCYIDPSNIMTIPNLFPMHSMLFDFQYSDCPLLFNSSTTSYY